MVVVMVIMVIITVVAMVIVMMQIMVGVMHFVNHRTTGHEQHSLGHCMVEEVEECCTEGNDNDVVSLVVVMPIKRIGKP